METQMAGKLKHGRSLQLFLRLMGAVPGAFISVATRRTLAGSSSIMPVQTSIPQVKKNETDRSSENAKSKRSWPQPVRDYVQRSFAAENYIPGVERQEMESRLKKVISEAAENGTLNDVQWKSLPLPQQMINMERLSAPAAWPVGFSTLSMKDANLTTNSTPSKKRKSSDKDSVRGINGHTRPVHEADNRNDLEDRISYPDKKPRHATADHRSSKSHKNLDNRKKRFDTGQNERSNLELWRPSTDEAIKEVLQGPVVGRCQDLEKQYFRLTSAPNPESVRPLEVLEKTLDHLKKKWRREKNYSYICDQFKSLRQDLTVQHIKNEFSVNVYEIHARIALERQDLSEYNQCQTQLRALYSQKLGGHPTEFLAYRILYFLHTSNRTDMNDVLADLTPTDKKDLAVKHALDVRSALALCNYHRFFQLYLETPNMGAYLMDMFVGRERLAALSNICKAYVLSTQTLIS